mmetsp:Transcript_37321/g.69676  ORF Transcript_37321/g.69676 Transcript_37321/m.69676 type:complete len:126 (-) Transcript_37321:38-415(-)
MPCNRELDHDCAFLVEVLPLCFAISLFLAAWTVSCWICWPSRALTLRPWRLAKARCPQKKGEPERLFTAKQMEMDGATCCVCLIEYEPDDVLRRLPCSHIFHRQCISAWLNCNIGCPICRKSAIA